MPSEEYEIIGKEEYQHLDMLGPDDLSYIRKELGVVTESFLALKSDKDPFYILGSAFCREDAQWFKDQWQMCGYTSGVHLRRMHYQLVSQEPKVKMRNGEQYVNTDKCWKVLGTASLAARYLDYVDPLSFVDRRNGDEYDKANYNGRRHIFFETFSGLASNIKIETSETFRLPYYFFQAYQPQPYHLEIWCEKSTQDDILQPLADDYELVVRHGMGELSVTIALEALQRCQRAGKPVRIFYLSDFDPNGWNMPKSMSRKVQYFNRKIEEYQLDNIQLLHFFLKPEQIREYNLPSTPLKDSHPAKDDFKSKFHADATELDALEALYPGELTKILKREIERFYDPTLRSRLSSFSIESAGECKRIQDGVYEMFSDEIAALKEKRESALAELDRIQQDYQEAQDDLFQRIVAELEQKKPVFDENNIPLPRMEDNTTDPLFDSGRSFLDQNAYYLEHKREPVKYAKKRGRRG